MIDTTNMTQAELFNFVQGSDITGQSAYDIWKSLGHTGSESDFLEFIRTGTKGDTGKSAYEEWVDYTTSVDKSYDYYLKIIKGDTGDKGDTGVTGSKGDTGATGDSAYQIWLNAGNTGTESEFISSLKGDKGDTGQTGDKGDTGPQGDSGLDWNENPVNSIKMRDVSDGKIYSITIDNGTIKVTAVS